MFNAALAQKRELEAARVKKSLARAAAHKWHADERREAMLASYRMRAGQSTPALGGGAAGLEALSRPRAPTSVSAAVADVEGCDEACAERPVGELARVRYDTGEPQAAQERLRGVSHVCVLPSARSVSGHGKYAHDADALLSGPGP